MDYQHLSQLMAAVAKAEGRLANAVDHARESDMRPAVRWLARLGWPFLRLRAEDEIRVAARSLREARARAALAAHAWVAAKAKELLHDDPVAGIQHAAVTISYSECVRITHRARRWETLARQADGAIQGAIHALGKVPDADLLSLTRDGSLCAAQVTRTTLVSWNAVRNAEKAMMALALALGGGRPSMDTAPCGLRGSERGSLDVLVAPSYDFIPLLSVHCPGDVRTSCHEARAALVPVIQRLTELVAEASDREQWTAVHIRRLERPFKTQAERLLPPGLQGGLERAFLIDAWDAGRSGQSGLNDVLSAA